MSGANSYMLQRVTPNAAVWWWFRRAAGRTPLREAAGLGFTATKKVGGSVGRNLARRRLREAARLLVPRFGVSGVDYVLIARQETGAAAWPRLLDDIEKALISLRRRFISDDVAPAPAAGPNSPAKA